MTKISVTKKDNNIVELECDGHTDYGVHGEDIVCSACSSIVTTTVNGILALKKGSLDYLVSKKGMTINVKIDDETTQILLNNMVSLLRELEGNYPNNIEVK